MIFATDVSGIYDKDPKKDPNAILLKEININEIEQILERMDESDKSDASGRMKGKILSLISAKDLIKNGLEVSIISMMKSGTLKKYFKGQDVDVTKVFFK